MYTDFYLCVLLTSSNKCLSSRMAKRLVNSAASVYRPTRSTCNASDVPKLRKKANEFHSASLPAGLRKQLPQSSQKIIRSRCRQLHPSEVGHGIPRDVWAAIASGFGAVRQCITVRSSICSAAAVITEAEAERRFGEEGGLSAALRPVITGQLLGLEEASTDNDRLRPGRSLGRGPRGPLVKTLVAKESSSTPALRGGRAQGPLCSEPNTSKGSAMLILHRI